MTQPLRNDSIVENRSSLGHRLDRSGADEAAALRCSRRCRARTASSEAGVGRDRRWRIGRRASPPPCARHRERRCAPSALRRCARPESPRRRRRVLNPARRAGRRHLHSAQVRVAPPMSGRTGAARLEAPDEMSRRARQLRRRRSRPAPPAPSSSCSGSLVATLSSACCAASATSSASRRLGAGHRRAQAASTRARPPSSTPPTARASASSSATTLRTPVAAVADPAASRNATVAIEDRRFYKHGGVDFEGIVRAAIKNVTSRRDRPGRLDADDAARPQPLHAEPRAQGIAATSARSARRSSPTSSRTHPGTRQDAGSSTSTSTTSRTGPSAARRRSASRPPRASSSTSPRGADAAGGRAARRPAAGAVAVQPVPRPRRPRCTRRNEVLDADGRARATSRRRRPTAAQRAPLGVKRTRYYAKRRESYFFDYVSSELIETLRRRRASARAG